MAARDPARGDRTGGSGPRGLRPNRPDDPGRGRPKPLGRPVGAPPGAPLVGLAVPDARHHVHVVGVTGSGKSTWLAGHTLAEAGAGRGVVLLDCQGDLARHVLDRLPAQSAQRLVVLDPAETLAPPAWNVLAPTNPAPPGTADSAAAAGGNGSGGEWAAENVVAVFRRLFGGWWGPRMDDLMRAACLTLIRRPGSTLADIVALLTSEPFRRELVARYGEPPGLVGYWASFDELSAGQRAQLCGPVLARLRGILVRRFARDLLTCPRSTLDLGAVLDGGILIARLPKGEIGEDTARLVGSLLLSGLWAAATRRSALPPDRRPDATVIVDEAQNFLHLPIGVDDALAEARGYRVSLVLAHQHLAQLPPDVGHALDANARTKVFFTVAPGDAHHLARHVAPVFDERDLAGRPAFHATIRAVHRGQYSPPFSVVTLPLPPPIRGRGEQMRAAARANAGLTAEQRAQDRQRLALNSSPAARHLTTPPLPPDPGPVPDGAAGAGVQGRRFTRRLQFGSPGGLRDAE